MSKQLYRSWQAVLLLALFLFFTSKVISNQLNWYINLRFMALTEIGIAFLAVLAQRLFMEARRANKTKLEEEHAHEHDHTPAPVNLWIMLIPLAIGILIPAKPLNSAAVSTKGLTT